MATTWLHVLGLLYSTLRLTLVNVNYSTMVYNYTCMVVLRGTNNEISQRRHDRMQSLVFFVRTVLDALRHALICMAARAPRFLAMYTTARKPGGPLLKSLPLFHAATRLTGSAAGFGGVLFLHWDEQQIVLKALADDADAVASLWVGRLLSLVNVEAPAVEVISLQGSMGRALQRRARERLSSGVVSNRLEKQRRTILESHSGRCLLMGFVDESSSLLPRDEHPTVGSLRLSDPGVAAALGRVMAVDVLINNWDRLPLGIGAWHPDPNGAFALAHPGNFDNILVRDRENAVIAIDNDVKSTYPSGTATTEDDYVAQLATVFVDLHASVTAGTVSKVGAALRDGISRLRDGIVLSDETIRVYERALHEAMCGLTAPGTLERAHAEAVGESGLGGAADSPAVRAMHNRAQRVAAAWVAVLSGP